MTVSTPRFVGESAFVRLWPPCTLAFAFVVMTSAGKGAVLFGVVVALCGVVFARFLPWRFAVVDEGLVLWFPFARRRFLPKDEITVRVGPGSPVALLNGSRRFGYPLSDGLVERRRLMLRSVLLEYGFRVA